MSLKGTSAIITGASRGLGKAIAQTLAARGVRLFLCANSGEVKNVCRELGAKGGECEAKIVDVAEKNEVETFVKEVAAKLGGIDFLINNAGQAYGKKPLEEIPYEEYKKTMSVNIDGVFYFMHAVLPIMKKQKSGMIINISSGAGKRGYGGLSAYSASKFAVMGLTQSVGWELKGTDVSCIAVCPAGIHTEMRAKIFGEEDASRQQSPEAVAKIVADVAEGKIQVPTGGDIIVKGGCIIATSNPLE